VRRGVLPPRKRLWLRLGVALGVEPGGRGRAVGLGGLAVGGLWERGAAPVLVRFEGGSGLTEG